jgi:hypothetical protein
MAQGSVSHLPLIGSTFTARATEDIYQHLREEMEIDDNIHAYVKKLMEESPSRALQMRPSFNRGSQTHIPLQSIVVPHAGNPRHPGPQASLFNHIKIAYENFRYLESKEYCKHIHGRLEIERKPEGEPIEEYFGDTELRRVEGWLQDYVLMAEKYLGLKLANRTYTSEL